MSDRIGVTDHPRAVADENTCDDEMLAVSRTTSDTDGNVADRNGDGTSSDTDSVCVPTLCAKIQSLQRARRAAMRLRMAITNGTTATVASVIGYHAGLEEKERRKAWKQAEKIVAAVDAGMHSDLGEPMLDADADDADRTRDAENVVGESADVTESVFAKHEGNGHQKYDAETFAAISPAIIGVVQISQPSRQSFAEYEQQLLDQMTALAAQLPVAPWFDSPLRRGIKLTILATVVGEAGDLSNYDGPAKLWRRLFGYPVEKNGETKMPSAWRRSKPSLSSEEWEEVGYSPRRNATMYSLRENIVKQNKGGPYRARYDAIRGTKPDNPKQLWSQEAKDHPDWTPGHGHAHAQLLAAKLFIKELWCEWNGRDAL